MSETIKRYPYLPVRERTQGLHENVCERFDELRRSEFKMDELRARYLPNGYYIDLLTEEFKLSRSYVRNIVNSRDRS